MPKSQIRLIFIFGLTVLVTVCALVMCRDPDLVADLTEEEIEWIRETRSLIMDSYVREVDSESLVYSALEGMVTSLDDYCAFYDPESEQTYKENTNGEHVGIGLKLRKTEAGVGVHFAYADSPAEQAGLQPNDLVVSIDGTSTRDLSLEECQERIKGTPGSTCMLVCDRPAQDGQLTFRVIRRVVTQPSVFGERVVDAQLGVGYMRVTGFNKGTRDAVIGAVASLKEKGARSLILDLRCNHGGLLEAALETANLFVGEGVLLRTQGRSPKANHIYEASPKLLRFPDVPVVILVNGHTASAAEVLAGTLQDHGRAVIAGSRTFGKGVVQSAFIRNFGEDVVVKLTTARYFTPLGRCIDNHMGNGENGQGGIEPDVSIDLTDEQSRVLRRHMSKRNVPNRYLEAILGDEAGKTCPDDQLDGALRILRDR